LRCVAVDGRVIDNILTSVGARLSVASGRLRRQDYVEPVAKGSGYSAWLAGSLMRYADLWHRTNLLRAGKIEVAAFSLR